MKKSILTTFILAIALIFISCNMDETPPARSRSAAPETTQPPANPTDTMPPKPETEIVGNVSVTFPGGSTVVKTGNSVSVSHGEGGTSALVLVARQSATEMTGEEFVANESFLENYYKSYSGNYDDPKEISKEVSKVAGRDAFEIQFVGKLSNGVEMKIRSIVFAHSGHIYNVLSGTPVTSEDTNEPFIKGVLDSIKLL